MLSMTGQAPRVLADSEWGYVATFDYPLYGDDSPRPERGVEYGAEIVEYGRTLGIFVVDAAKTTPHEGDYIMAGASVSDEEVLEAVPDIRIPHTEIYEQYSVKTHFPVVAKALGADRGELKFLLERPEQWQRLNKLLTGDGPLRRIDPELRQQYQDVAAYENPIDAFQKPSQDRFTYQDFIKTPSDHYTSYRVLVTATGKTLASSLYYSSNTVHSATTVTTPGSIHNWGKLGDDSMDFLTTPDSLVYLGARRVISNHAGGGRSIVLDPTPASKAATDKDKEILQAHGLDPNRPALPQPVREQSQYIAQALGRKHGLILGIDWLQDDRTGEYYYLETNLGPVPGAFADAHMGGTEQATLDQALVAVHKAALDTLH